MLLLYTLEVTVHKSRAYAWYVCIEDFISVVLKLFHSNTEEKMLLETIFTASTFHK